MMSSKGSCTSVCGGLSATDMSFSTISAISGSACQPCLDVYHLPFLHCHRPEHRYCHLHHSILPSSLLSFSLSLSLSVSLSFSFSFFSLSLSLSLSFSYLFLFTDFLFPSFHSAESRRSFSRPHDLFLSSLLLPLSRVLLDLP